MAIHKSLSIPSTLLLILVIMTISSSTTAAKSPSSSATEGWTPFPKRKVTVANELTRHEWLQLECRSKDDDLGRQTLKNKYKYHFSFFNSGLGNTHFYCWFQWGEGIRWFDIYIQERDSDRCVHCNWSVRETGPCLTNNHDNWRICYQWNK